MWAVCSAQPTYEFHMPSRTTPTHIQPVPGCPPTVQIYRIEASRFWQFRYFVQGRYVRKSTQLTNKSEALRKAKDLYRDIIVKERQDVSVHPTTFYAVAKQFLDSQALQIEVGNITSRSHQEDIYKLKSDVLPFFQSMDVSTLSKRREPGETSALTSPTVTSGASTTRTQ